MKTWYAGEELDDATLATVDVSAVIGDLGGVAKRIYRHVRKEWEWDEMDEHNDLLAIEGAQMMLDYLARRLNETEAELERVEKAYDYEHGRL